MHSLLRSPLGRIIRTHIVDKPTARTAADLVKMLEAAAEACVLRGIPEQLFVDYVETLSGSIMREMARSAYTKVQRET